MTVCLQTCCYHCLCRYYPVSKSSKPAKEAEEDNEIELSIEAQLILSPALAVCFIQPYIMQIVTLFFGPYQASQYLHSIVQNTIVYASSFVCCGSRDWEFNRMIGSITSACRTTP